MATKTAADSKSGKAKGKNGSRVKRLLDITEKTLDLQEKMNAVVGDGKGGINPAMLFAAQPVDKEAARCGGFKSPREFLQAVIDHGMGREMDKRLKGRYVKTAGSDEGSTQSNPYGGFLIPIGFVPDVLKVDPEADPIGAATTKIPMGNPIVNIPARVDKNHTTSVSGGLTVARKAETLAAAASRMQFEQVTLEAHSLFGVSYATEELLTDSPQSFAAIISAGFNDQFVSHLIDERLNGDGVGKYMGVMNSPCLVTITKEVGQAATTLVYDNILKMRARCWGYANAFWLANHDCTPQLMKMNQAVGTGGAVVWQPSAREDHPDTLLGRPLYFTEYTQTVGTVGDLVLGNWKEYLEGQYQAQMQDESVHVRFLEHERTFKVWVRNAGQPWWRSALTPKRSSATMSPFVVLETRS